MKGQLNLFEPEFIKDIDCTVDTPVTRGNKDKPIYGTGKRIKPRVPGRRETKHMEEIYLEELLPLEEYDLIVVLISGGKDSIATYFKLRELGVPKSKIEFWHHDIDGGNPERHMDWRCTQSYMKALADAEGIPLRLSWRKGGFFGELYRIGASKPIEWVDPETGEIMSAKETPQQAACRKIEESNVENKEELLKEYGCRMKFPAKSGNLMTRWCSPYLKIDVAATVLRNLEEVKENSKVLFSTPELFAGFKELYPQEFEEMKHDEKALGFTLDNKCDLETYIEGAKPCLYKGDKEAIHSLITGIFTESQIFIDGQWKYPAGAFHGAEGGPC